jgi:hypothetical protein
MVETIFAWFLLIVVPVLTILVIATEVYGRVYLMQDLRKSLMGRWVDIKEISK